MAGVESTSNEGTLGISKHCKPTIFNFKWKNVRNAQLQQIILERAQMFVNVPAVLTFFANTNVVRKTLYSIQYLWYFTNAFLRYYCFKIFYVAGNSSHFRNETIKRAWKHFQCVPFNNTISFKRKTETSGHTSFPLISLLHDTSNLLLGSVFLYKAEKHWELF